MNILFICSMAAMRSPTAAACLKTYSTQTRCRGTDNDAIYPITQEDMDWADHIICMEMCHRSKLRRKFKGYSHKMTVWDIPDEYGYMDDKLVVILKGKYQKMFGG